MASRTRSAKGTSRRTNQLTGPRAERPFIPGYGLPESKQGLLPWSWAQQRLSRSRNYWLVTVRPGSLPHAMPVWGIWVDAAFYFSTGRGSRKAKNLVKNAHCIVCTEDAADAAIVEGIAQEVKSAKRLKQLGAPYHAKYKPWKLDPTMGPVFEVRPSVAFGMAEKQFTRATRWRF